MLHKVTISMDDVEYKNLSKLAGRKRIEYVVKDIVRQRVVSENLEDAYKAMAHEEEREQEAHEWSEATIHDVSDEPR
ncbi:MAG: addiction module antitoxin [Ignavibacteriae bacterium]|nr:addiction module antitoxin [Ignavibacteriota bacterium]